MDWTQCQHLHVSNNKQAIQSCRKAAGNNDISTLARYRVKKAISTTILTSNA